MGAPEPLAPDPDGPTTPQRPDIDERAARRASLTSRSDDRYEALLRHLQAGHELPVPVRRRSFGLDIHPSAGKIVLLPWGETASSDGLKPATATVHA